MPGANKLFISNGDAMELQNATAKFSWSKKLDMKWYQGVELN